MKPTSRILRYLATLGGSILAISSAMAQTTYSFTQAAGGLQLWENAANWSGGSIPDPVAGDTITTNLTMSAKTFLDLGADRTIGNWSANFQGFGSRDFEINSGHTLTLAGTTPTVTVTSGSIILQNILAGTNGFKKEGAGTLALNDSHPIAA